jgi:hypothetical protein
VANLIQAYEYYLLATFLLGALQVRTYLAMIRFAMSVPGRWPELYQILKANIGTLLTWPLVVIGSFTTGLWALHVILRRLLWPQAVVTWERLTADTLWFALTAFFGLTMLVLDGWALLRVARFKPPRLQWLLTATDYSLRSSKLGTPLRMLVGWHLQRKLLKRMPMLVQWTLRRTAEVGARLAFGLCLWGGWALGLG